MKKPYSAPELTVEIFDDADIVSRSDDEGGFGGGDGGGWEGSRSASGNDNAP